MFERLKTMLIKEFIQVLRDKRMVVFETDDNSQVIAKYLDSRLQLGLFPAELEGVQIGGRWVVGGVDLSLLCAPVMRFEADALEADWATRSPVASGYEKVGELPDFDGTHRCVVAHVVDGYKHYGGVVVPPVKPLKKLPVLVLCHPGDGGTSLTNQSWFFDLLSDPTLRQRFVQVIPSFRGETLDADSLGTFRSEGPGACSIGMPTTRSRCSWRSAAPRTSCRRSGAIITSGGLPL